METLTHVRPHKSSTASRPMLAVTIVLMVLASLSLSACNNEGAAPPAPPADTNTQ
jgi:hypothetical protein